MALHSCVELPSTIGRGGVNVDCVLVVDSAKAAHTRAIKASGASGTSVIVECDHQIVHARIVEHAVENDSSP